MHRKCGVRDTVEYKEHRGDQRRKKRMQEKKKVSIRLFFLLPFDLPFLSNHIFKKNFEHEKVFISFPGTFSNEQKESKNHINQF